MKTFSCPPAVSWSEIATAAADRFDDRLVTVTGFAAPPEPDDREDYLLLLGEPLCCIGCVPTDPLAAVEVFLGEPLASDGSISQPQVRLIGRWCRLIDDPAGWRYQLRDARAIALEPAGGAAAGLTRRGLLAAGSLAGLAACAPVRLANHIERAAAAKPATEITPAADRTAMLEALAAGTTVDLHSHAGRVSIGRAGIDRPFLPLAEPMRAGAMALVCLAIVADSPTTRTEDGRRIVAYRSPDPGELYAWGQRGFARAHRLIAEQGLTIVTDGPSLDRASAQLPSVIVASEGADFLEGNIDRVDEAYRQHQLRHLQLTHFRVNELGDIQTAAPVHGGLTDFGAEVIRRCNSLGVVVDVAHGPFDLVKRAAAVTTKPLVLSHTALGDAPGPRSRHISADHARLIAGTGGVIGIWPPSTDFADLAAMAAGMARMVDIVGVDHVGLGSDMLGLLSPAVFANYTQLPDLALALRGVGFKPDEIARILGGNYVRVLRASLA